MPLSAADFAALNQLMDEALALGARARRAWFDSLPDSPRKALLGRMMAEHAGRETADFLSALPRIAADSTPDGSEPQAGEAVGPYRLLREIGRGGMGTVWLAERIDGSLKRQIALKLPRLAWGAGLAERMARERDIGALLAHAHIARLYDAGVDERGRPFLALEYLDGQPIDHWCREQALPVRARLQLFLQVIGAVAYAHARLVVHRDLKPSNVLVTADGQAHLLDFGIAKLLGDEREHTALTRREGGALTPHYASPEQLRGDTVTAASDVFSLGVLLYELLTGSLPHDARRGSLAALEEEILGGTPTPASKRVADKAEARALRGDVDAILAKALRSEPELRYATADAMAQDIERHLHGERVLAQPDSLRYRLGKAFRRHKLASAAVAAAVFSLLAGSAVALRQATHAQEAAERARVVKEFVVDVFKVNGRGAPADSGLRQLPAELLLEHGASLIEPKFKGQPGLQAELFGVVAEIFADLGANALAATYADKRLQALQADGDGDPHALARAWMFRTRVLLADGRLDEAEAAARQAGPLVRGDAALQARALLQDAQLHVARSHNDQALQALDRLDAMIATQAHRSALAAQAALLRAQVLRTTNHFDEALPVYLAAIDQSLQLEGPLSATAIEARLQLSDALLTVKDDPVQSRQQMSAAVDALRRTGGAADLRAAREEAEFHTSMYQMGKIEFEEARSVVEEDLRRVAAHGAMVPEEIRARLKLDLGSLYLDWGDVARGRPLIEEAAVSMRARSQAVRDRYLLAGLQGTAAMYAGHHEQAAALFGERMELQKLGGRARHPFAAYGYAFAALNLVMQQRFDEADALLASAPVLDALRGGTNDVYAGVILRMRARTALERGAFTAAEALLQPAETDDDTKFPFDDRALRGEILCAAGQRTAGLALLQEVLERHAAHDNPDHPHLMHLRATAGACHLANGQREQALQLARAARASLQAQPEVSAYFKRPIERLEAKLHIGPSGRELAAAHTGTPAR